MTANAPFFRLVSLGWAQKIALAILLAAMLGDVPLPVRAAATEPDDPWPELAQALFKDRVLQDGTGLITLETPYRAEDAAIVPVGLRTTLPPGDTRQVKAFTLVIDQNPAPVVGTFVIGPNAGLTAIATRVRVDSYTNIHAVAELSDGQLYVVKTFVKAAGGCSAPAAKTADDSKISLGQMRLRQFDKSDSPQTDNAGRPLHEAQIMIRHPNNSGLQMDQVTRLYVPAKFIRDLKVWQGNDLILAMDGGISISEDPNIRFNFVPNGAATFSAAATDTDNQVFKGEWPVEPSM